MLVLKEHMERGQGPLLWAAAEGAELCEMECGGTYGRESSILKMWNQSRSLSSNEWAKKMWCIYAVGFHSAIKNEILPFVRK